MTETLEQIAMRIDTALTNDGKVATSAAYAIEFAKRLVEALGAQEHVAYMIEHNGKVMGFVSTPENGTIPVYKAPRI